MMAASPRQRPEAGPYPPAVVRPDRQPTCNAETRTTPIRGVSAIRFENFPTALVERDQWVCWLQTKEGTKIPCSPHTGKAYCDAHDPTNWGSLDEARTSAERHRFAGVGYDITEPDNMTCIDLDDCIP